MLEIQTAVTHNQIPTNFVKPPLNGLDQWKFLFSNIDTSQPQYICP